VNVQDFFSLFRGRSGPAMRPYGPGVKTGEFEGETAAFTEEDGQIVMKYYETICQAAGDGRVPTVADLPCPPHRIHMALTRAARDDGAPPHIKRIARGAINSLVIFQ
jgi:hypothetical protein